MLTQLLIPLTAQRNLAHGHAIALTLGPIVEWNHQNSEARAIYQDLEAILEEPLLSWLRETLTLAKLSPLDIADRELIPKLAADAASQWTGQFNPHPLTEQDYRNLYQQIATSLPTAS